MKRLLLPAVLIAVGLLLAACGGPPPPLRSDKYLNDRSLITDNPCAAPCFQNIVVGETTFTTALESVKANPLFKDVQSQDNPPQAGWAAVNGDPCCQMTGNAQTGKVDAMLIRVAPTMRIGEAIAKFGPPEYVSVGPQDYSAEEAVLAVLFPKQNVILYVVPGNPASDLDENDPVVAVIYVDPANFSTVVESATLWGWQGYRAYSDYKTATPIVTPRPTLTPTPGQ